MNPFLEAITQAQQSQGRPAGEGFIAPANPQEQQSPFLSPPATTPQSRNRGFLVSPDDTSSFIHQAPGLATGDRPIDDVNRMANALNMQKLFPDTDPGFLFENHDRLAEEITGKPTPPTAFGKKILTYILATQLQIEQADIWANIADRAKASGMMPRPTEEEQERLDAIARQMPDVEAIRGSGFFNRFTEAVVSQATRSLNNYSRSLGGWALPVTAGAMLGGMAAIAMTGGAATPVVAGGVISTMGKLAMLAAGKSFYTGLSIGATLEGRRQEYGIAMAELMELRDNNGNPIDPDLALWGASIYANGASLLEAWGASTMIKMIPGMRELIGEGAASYILKGGIKHVFATNLARYGTNAIVQGAEEMSQALFQGLVREAAIAEYNNRHDGAGNEASEKFLEAVRMREEVRGELSNEEIEELKELHGVNDVEEGVREIMHEWEEIVPSMWDEGSQAFLAALGLGAPGAVTSTRAGVQYAQRNTISEQAKSTPYGQSMVQQAPFRNEPAPRAQEIPQSYGNISIAPKAQVQYETESQRHAATQRAADESQLRGRQVQTGTTMGMQSEYGLMLENMKNPIQTGFRSLADRIPVIRPIAHRLLGEHRGRSYYIQREIGRLQAMPESVIARNPELQQTIIDLEKFGLDGRPIEKVAASDMGRTVLTNSVHEVRGVTQGRTINANTDALRFKYLIDEPTARRIAQANERYAEMQGLPVSRRIDFTNFEQARSDIRRLAERNAKLKEKPITDVHFVFQDFYQYAAQRLETKEISALYDDWKSSLENFMEIMDVYEDAPKIKFTIDTPRDQVTDYRVGLSMLKPSAVKRVQEAIGRRKKTGSRPSKEQISQFIDMMFEDVRVVQQDREIVGSELTRYKDMLEENPNFSEEDQRTYTLKGKYKLSEDQIDRIMPQIETRAMLERSAKRARARAEQRAALTQSDIENEFTAAAAAIFEKTWAKRDEWTNIARRDRARMETQLNTWVKKRNPDAKKEELAKEFRRWNMAMLFYRDAENMFDYISENYSQNFTPEQMDVFNDARSLPRALKEVVAEVDKLYQRHLDAAIDAEVITELRDNYATILWKQEEFEDSTSRLKMFRPETDRNKRRAYDSIAQGWFAGEELAVTSLTETYEIYADSVETAIAHKKFIDAGLEIKNIDGTPLFTTQPGTPGYKEVSVENLMAKDHVRELTESEIKDGPQLKHGQVAENGQVYQYSKIFAPTNIALLLEDSFNAETLSIKSWARFAARWTNIRKKIKLVSNFFHPLAYFRSYLIGTNGKTLGQTVRPIREMRTMLKVLHGEDPEVLRSRTVPDQLREIAQDGIEATHEMMRILYQQGLTFEMRKDFYTLQQTGTTLIGQWMDKHAVTAKARDFILTMSEAMHRLTFDIIGPGLKAASAIAELQHALKHDPTTAIETHAKRVAMLINDDYGGLNLRREGRSQNHQFIFRLFALAPDWTESNVRTMGRMIDGRVDAETRQMYHRFWKRAIMKVLMANHFANLMVSSIAWVAGTEEDDPFAQQVDRIRHILDSMQQSDEYPEKIMDALHFLEVDLTPLWRMGEEIVGRPARGMGLFNAGSDRIYSNMIGGHFNDIFKFGLATFRSARGKSSMVFQDLMMMIDGTDWKGYAFKTAHDWRNDPPRDILEYIDKETYVTWGSGVGSQVRVMNGSAWSFAAYLLLNAMPVQVDQLFNFAAGRTDGMSAIMTSFGIGVRRMKPYKTRRSGIGYSGPSTSGPAITGGP